MVAGPSIQETAVSIDYANHDTPSLNVKQCWTGHTIPLPYPEGHHKSILKSRIASHSLDTKRSEIPAIHVFQINTKFRRLWYETLLKIVVN